MNIGMSDQESDDDRPQLSSDTMNALLEFYKEQDEREQKLQEIQGGCVPDNFDENWNLSQFWYADDTANLLAKECLRVAGDEGAIACISSPTLYKTLHSVEKKCKVHLFEYDTRFAVYKDDFTFYDYKSPLDIPRDFRETFDVIVADPPYLSDECLTKTAVTVKFVAKPNAKIIICTGAVMENLAHRLCGVKKSNFVIRHANQLSNPFVCFANYDIDATCKYS
ncbi:EEF1A lysine methyltransferase 1 isoform X2 [Oratosquilla oratoria]|uniref:EEF1A lysine methyltransferase 1 isoform X2 n=1 Tax=Oratosquilla oratoria TaxID=337810 RepID=UPI003F77185C